MSAKRQLRRLSRSRVDFDQALDRDVVGRGQPCAEGRIAADACRRTKSAFGALRPRPDIPPFPKRDQRAIFLCRSQLTAMVAVCRAAIQRRLRLLIQVNEISSLSRIIDFATLEICFVLSWRMDGFGRRLRASAEVLRIPY